MILDNPFVSGSLVVQNNLTASNNLTTGELITVGNTTGSNALYTGTLNVLGGITGSLLGTASTSSYIDYSNVANKPTLISSSLQITSLTASLLSTGNILPTANDVYDLGSPTRQWRDLYLSSASLYVDGVKVLSSNTDTLTFSTDVGQSIKILETGADDITLQTDTGNIELKGTVEILSGKKITDSAGTVIQFGDSLGVTGSIEVSGTVDGIDLQQASGSFSSRITAQELFSSSIDDIFATEVEVLNISSSLSASLAIDIATNDGRLDTLEGKTILSSSAQIATDISGSLGTNATLIRSLTATGITGSFTSLSSSIATDINTKLNVADTGSFAKTNVNNVFTGVQTFDSISVNGTASFNYIQSVTGSATYIGEQYVVVNASTEGARFAGIQVYDSESALQHTASLAWDSLRNHWVYANPSGSYHGGGLISGPRNSGSLGDETYPSLNYIVRGQGGDHIYDSNIIDDDTSVKIGIDTEITGSLLTTGNVGIGTTSPVFPIHVNTSNDVVGYFKSTDNKASILIADNDTAGYVSAENDRVSIGYGNGVSTANITILNGSYNVGIGTTSPNEKLQVTGNIHAYAPSGIDASLFASTAAGSTTIALRSNGITYFNGGNVGIGTTSPGAKLHVDGTAIFDTQTGAQPFYITRDGVANQALKIYVDDAAAVFESIQDETADDYGSFIFKMDGGTTHPYFDIRKDNTTQVRFDGSGNVGIGTTTPSAKLNIYDTFTKTEANPNTVEVFHSGNVTANNIYPVAGLFTQQVSGGANVFATGLVGIADKLGDYGYIARGVQGIGKLSGNVTVNNADMQYMGVEGRIEMEGSNSVNLDDRAYSLYGTAEIDSGSHLKEYHGLYLNTPTNNGTILNKYGVSQVDSNSKNYFAGNIGIGTSNPSVRLDIQGTGQARQQLLSLDNQGARFDLASQGGSRHSLQALANGDFMMFDEANGHTTQRYFDGASSAWAFYTVGTERMRIDSSGRVGIGTTSPAIKLSVNGGSDNNVAQFTSTDSLAYITFKDNSTTSDTSVALGANGDEMTFYTGTSFGLERMRIDSSGNVGIGTTNPIMKLQVTGNIYANNGNVFIDSGQRLVWGNSAQWIEATNNTSMEFSGGGSSVDMTLLANGNVGIGNTSPTYKLSVSGGIVAGGKATYSKNYSSLDTTGQAVAGLTTSYNGTSAGFVFTCFGGGGYQKVVYSCINVSGTWTTVKSVDEGNNAFDIVASANGTTITFTFKARTTNQNYTPRVTVEAFGSAINNTYA